MQFWLKAPSVFPLPPTQKNRVEWAPSFPACGFKLSPVCYTVCGLELGVAKRGFHCFGVSGGFDCLGLVVVVPRMTFTSSGVKPLAALVNPLTENECAKKENAKLT